MGWPWRDTASSGTRALRDACLSVARTVCRSGRRAGQVPACRDAAAGLACTLLFLVLVFSPCTLASSSSSPALRHDILAPFSPAPAGSSAPVFSVPAALLPPVPAGQDLSGQELPGWGPLMDRLAADGYERGYVHAVFSALGCPPRSAFMALKVIEVANLRYAASAVLALPPEEAEGFTPPTWRGLGGLTAAAGRAFMNRNASLFSGIYKRYGVAAPYIVAILMVETGLGGELGNHPALLSLGSMASSRDIDAVLPVISGLESLSPEHRGTLATVVSERSEWAYQETRALLDYCQASGKAPADLSGSIYGAIGLPQFMPSNIPLYGVDADGDNVVDLFTLADAAHSIARYLSAHGWKNAQSPDAKLAVLRRYNNSEVYAATVYGVAMQLVSPTTHGSAQAARNGGNAISAAQRDARAAIPARASNAPPLTLGGYQ